MAIPKKNSRLITVDGVIYRWRFRSKGVFHPCCCGPLRFAAQLAENPGRVLVVSFEALWPEIGSPGIPITPRLVAASVREALRRGWEPASPGSAFTFTVTNEDLAVLLETVPDRVAAASA